MNKFILLMSSAILLSASPALAKPGAHGGNTMHMTAKTHIAGARTSDARVGVSRHRVGHRAVITRARYGGAGCAPGLAKKSPACMPPGQAKRLFRQGQRVGNGYRYYTPYSNIPVTLRNQYNLDDNYRYIYRNNTIYVVDPTTSLVTRIINAIH